MTQSSSLATGAGWIPLAEAEAQLGRTVRAAAHRGEIRAIRPGRRIILLDREDFARWLKSRELVALEAGGHRAA